MLTNLKFFMKVNSCVISCETIEQLNTAMNWATKLYHQAELNRPEFRCITKTANGVLASWGGMVTPTSRKE